MSVDLLPCPLCGGNNTYIEPDEVGSGGQWVAPIHVGCKDCGLDMAQHDYTDDAVAAWNRRAATGAAGDPEPVGVVEEHGGIRWFNPPIPLGTTLYAQALRHQSTGVTEITEEIVERAAKRLALCAWDRLNAADSTLAKEKYPNGPGQYVAERWRIYEQDARHALIAALSAQERG